MPNFWESKGPTHWAHGFLICGDAQASDYEFHGSFPRSGALPHISVYERGKRDRKINGNMNFIMRNGTAGLNRYNRKRFLDLSGMSAAKRDDFIKAVWDRHLLLNPPAVQPAPAQPFVVDAADFPALPNQNAIPPMVAAQPVAEGPADFDPVMQQYNSLSPELQSVVRMSGVFDA